MIMGTTPSGPEKYAKQIKGENATTAKRGRKLVIGIFSLRHFGQANAMPTLLRASAFGGRHAQHTTGLRSVELLVILIPSFLNFLTREYQSP